MNGIAGLIFWVIFFIFISIVKNSAKKADKSNRKVPPHPPKDGVDPLQDFFNQINNVSRKVNTSSGRTGVSVGTDRKSSDFTVRRSAGSAGRSSVHEHRSNVESVEDFFKVSKKMKTFQEPVRSIQKNIPKKSEKISVDVQDNISEETIDEKASINSYSYKDNSASDSEAYSKKERIKVENLSQESMLSDNKFDMRKIKQAVIWAEIIGKPKALQKS